jgi:hypothetical protein
MIGEGDCAAICGMKICRGNRRSAVGKGLIVNYISRRSLSPENILIAVIAVLFDRKQETKFWTSMLYWIDNNDRIPDSNDSIGQQSCIYLFVFLNSTKSDLEIYHTEGIASASVLKLSMITDI